MKKEKEPINIIMLDSRDSRFQTGIGRYFDVLMAGVPSHVRIFKVIFYHSPEIKDVRISQSDREISVYSPDNYPSATLYEAVIAFLGPRLAQMKNIVVQSNCLGCEGFAYLLKSRFYLKTVGALHCLPHRAYGGNGSFPPNNPFFNMDKIILVCDTGVEYLNGVNNTRPYSVIYNGIEKPKINSKHPSDGVFRFIWANGLGRHKQFEIIIPAIRAVAQKHDIEVLLLGGGEMDKSLSEKIADLPIRQIGLVNDEKEISEYYEMADCALFASASEACPFAGIEAMAYNLPIVSTNAAGLTEMFARGSAIFVPMGQGWSINPDDYADAMLRIIEKRTVRTKLSVLAYSRYCERYTAKKMIADTVSLWEDLVAE